MKNFLANLLHDKTVSQQMADSLLLEPETWRKSPSGHLRSAKYAIHLTVHRYKFLPGLRGVRMSGVRSLRLTYRQQHKLYKRIQGWHGRPVVADASSDNQQDYTSQAAQAMSDRIDQDILDRLRA